MAWSEFVAWWSDAVREATEARRDATPEPDRQSVTRPSRAVIMALPTIPA